MANNNLGITFTALRCQTRRALIEKLALGPACVGDLAKAFPISAPAVSQHVKVLEEAGIVRRTTRGQQRIISLEFGPLRAAQQWLDRQQGFWEAQLDSLHDHLSKKRKRRRKVRQP